VERKGERERERDGKIVDCHEVTRGTSEEQLVTYFALYVLSLSY